MGLRMHSFLVLATGVAADVIIATFDGAKGTTLQWRPKNDLAMGGRSTSTFHVDHASKTGIFNGTCATVPFLNAPGFIKVFSSGEIADVSTCKNLVLNVRSTSPYQGFRVSFGIPKSPGGLLTLSNFQAPMHQFEDVVLPFTGFTDHSNDCTGDPITTNAEVPKMCPNMASLQNMETVSIWGADVVGDVHLEIKSIRASGCNDTVVYV